MGYLLNSNRVLYNTPTLRPDTNGMVLFLDAANNLSYNGSGLTWFDLSPEGNNCLLEPTYTPYYNNASRSFTFDASQFQRATVINDSSLNFGTGDFTILHYSNHLLFGQVSGGCALYKGAKFDSNRAGWLVTAHAGFSLYQVVSDGLQRIEMWFPTPGNDWNYKSGWYGLMRRGGLIYHIYDGVISPMVPTNPLQSTDYTMNVDSIDDINIGYNPVYNNYFNMNLSKVLIYNRGITNDEMVYLNNNRSRFLQTT